MSKKSRDGKKAQLQDGILAVQNRFKLLLRERSNLLIPQAEQPVLQILSTLASEGKTLSKLFVCSRQNESTIFLRENYGVGAGAGIGIDLQIPAFLLLCEAFKPFQQARSELKKMCLWTTDLGDIGLVNLASHLPNFVQLQTLELLDSSIGYTGASSLSMILLHPSMSNLKFLRLDHNPLGCQGIVALAPSLEGRPKLECLSLNYCEIKAKGCAYLAHSIKNSQCTLRELSLEGNPLGPAGISALSIGIAINTSLRRLNLSCTSFCFLEVSSGLRLLLDASMHNKSLTTIDLDGNLLSSMDADAIVECMGREESQHIHSIFVTTLLPKNDFQRIAHAVDPLLDK